jgi:hypothetical protein
MINLKYCYPDSNNFHSVIEMKSVDELEYEYVDLGYGVGYWLVDNPFKNDSYEIFKNLIASFPIQIDNSYPEYRAPNPFDTIHLPEWIYKTPSGVIRDMYAKLITSDWYGPQLHEWGNVYYKERSRPITCWRIPHIDYVYGMVANLWFTGHDIQDSGTKLYKYHGTMHDEIYDFQVDTTHLLFEEWTSMSTTPTRADAWFNFSNEELSRWGFEYLGTAPSIEKTMTVYQANVHHTAYVSENVDFRWSHTFAFSHENPKRVKDLFNL